MNIFKKIARYRKRIKKIKDWGWIRVYTDQGTIYTCIDRYGARYITKRELWNFTNKDFKLAMRIII